MCPLCLLPLGSECAVDPAQEGRAQPQPTAVGQDVDFWIFIFGKRN